MVFNSFDFLVFFPIVVFVYFIIPVKARGIWLLITSYYFYMSWNPKYALLIVASTVITYISGILIKKCRERERTAIAKYILIVCLICNLSILIVFKYSNFLLSSISTLFSLFGIQLTFRHLDFLLPVGISFYTFQALGYTLDVYKRKIDPEPNFLKYSLFVSFFPQLVAGPIERSEELLPQIQNVEKIKVWNYPRIKDGFFLMMWGLFQKIVIADRISLLVDTVVHDYSKYGFLEISVAMVLFAIQIYCDFDGYSNMARGAASIMGFKLMQNFKRPYLAGNIKDFWDRWHISLTSWFTDYLYIPLGGNRKGCLRKYLNILIVFGVSGIWHGASWNYVVWGLIHALFRIVGDIKFRITSKYALFRTNTCFSSRLRNMTGTFILVDFAWIFFVADSFRHGVDLIRQMFSAAYTVGVTDLGLDSKNWIVLLGSVVILLFVDLLRENGYSLSSAIEKQEMWFRWILYFGLIWCIIMFGIYGFAYDASTFIYFQF